MPHPRSEPGLVTVLAAGLLVAVWAPVVVGQTVGPTLPGALSRDRALESSLAEALRSKGPDYRPRTRHLTTEGQALFTNRLILETSPYLLQHAHNPVDWFPWGDEAFERARELGRPVLLSVGYSTCHWCHVMEEESFEDEAIARFLNERYVAVKVDREERPDVDAIYMRAVQLLSGRGGWPMTVWLTPDREPFFGGTYFPPRDGDRGVGTGFLTLLQRLRDLYDRDPARVKTAAQDLTREVRDSLRPASGGSAPPAPSALDAAFRHYSARYDPENGGLQGAPKFPSGLPIRFLLREHRRTGRKEPLDMSARTLERMADGGIHDHIGGGFHRYATDERWLVPHFEKMLYDNALLVLAYLEGHQATGREDFAEVARSVLDYVEREMSAPHGGFYSATDADSVGPDGHREEGYFFTWTPDEVRDALGEDDARPFTAYFAVTDEGNFEGRSILSTPRTLEELAGELGLDPSRMRRELDVSRERLLGVRSRRPRPLRDEKSLAAWNGLMISALARAAFVLDDERHADRAVRAAGFVLDRMRIDGRLHRSFTDGRARIAGYLQDYAFVVAGLLDLYETTGTPRWLQEAMALDGVLEDEFEDREGGGFYRVAAGQEALLAREKPAQDGAEPSGNSVHALNLLRLHELTTRDAYRVRAEAALAAFAPSLTEYPAALPEMLLAVELHHAVAKQIVIVAPSASEAEPFLEVLRRTFLPNAVRVVVEEGSVASHADTVPLLAEKVAMGGQATAYVCERQVCKRPTTEPAVFRGQITAGTPDAR